MFDLSQKNSQGQIYRYMVCSTLARFNIMEYGIFFDLGQKNYSTSNILVYAYGIFDLRKK